MTACWVLCSRLTYFWRNTNISSFFYFSKSTSINTQYSSLYLWDTLQMMLFTEYLMKWKRIGRISWNVWYQFNLKSSIELDIRKIDVIVVQCPFNTKFCLMKWFFYKLWGYGGFCDFKIKWGSWGTASMNRELDKLFKEWKGASSTTHIPIVPLWSF